MRLLALPPNARFSNKYIVAFLIPIIIEQIALGVMGMLDTVMVSSMGEAAVAGVGLVSRIDTFAKQFLIALGTGGSVVLAQHIGANDMQKARRVLENNIIIVIVFGILVMLCMSLFKRQVINLFFGSAKNEVIEKSLGYFSVTAFSYPFVALYYGCKAQFRVMGRSNLTLVATIIMMTINLILKYIFIYVIKMGVYGASLSTLIAMATMGFVLLFELKSERNKVKLSKLREIRFSKKISGKILGISVPNGIEQGMFQLGALLIASLVSSLGTASIAADQIARNVATFMSCSGAGFGALIMSVVGQCVGAGDMEDAKRYTKHILKMDYIVTGGVAVVFLFLLKPLLGMFNVSAETRAISTQIMTIYAVASALLYPSSFAVPSALRGAGDTRFVMLVAGLSMLLFRVGAAYVFARAFKMGVLGTYFAMISDWVVRTVIFYIRYRSGKWKESRVI